MKFAIALCFLAIANAAPFKPEIDTEWQNFKMVYAKTYKGEEEGARRLIWEQNVAKIVKHNLDYNLGKKTYTLGLNEYSDLTHSEFVSTMDGYKQSSETSGAHFTFLPPSKVKLPSSVDWRKEGLVTPVKNQQKCGSCWAFSATGSLEGQHKKKTGKLVSLSEQNLVDCSRPEGNMGCEGGWMKQSFQYIIKNGGINTEASYPYIGYERNCTFKQSTIGATVKGYVDVKSGDEDALLKAVATVGPISVTIDASSFDFQFYESGVYDEINCSTTDLDHGVLVVGYGSEYGIDYWLVKNSWGAHWGEDGYIKMARNETGNLNMCGIATAAIYPLV